jgi:hypothetical protein
MSILKILSYFREHLGWGVERERQETRFLFTASPGPIPQHPSTSLNIDRKTLSPAHPQPCVLPLFDASETLGKNAPPLSAACHVFFFFPSFSLTLGSWGKGAAKGLCFLGLPQVVRLTIADLPWAKHKKPIVDSETGSAL